MASVDRKVALVRATATVSALEMVTAARTIRTSVASKQMEAARIGVAFGAALAGATPSASLAT